MVVTGLAALLTLASCSPTPQPCPRLEERLFRLAVSADPEAFASQAGLYYREGRLRVIAELESPQAPSPSLPGLVVEARAAELVQALVPPDRLCSLASAEGVRLVRSPVEPTR